MPLGSSDVYKRQPHDIDNHTSNLAATFIFYLTQILAQQQLSVHSLKPRKFVLSAWLTVKVNCLKKSTTLSLLKQLTNGSNGKKISTLMSLFTVNLSVTTWLSTSVKTCQVTSSLRTVGCNHTAVSYTHLDVYKRQLVSVSLQVFQRFQPSLRIRWRFMSFLFSISSIH